MKRIVNMREYATKRAAQKERNEMILERIVGIPASPATAQTEEDPQNPNVRPAPVRDR